MHVGKQGEQSRSLNIANLQASWTGLSFSVESPSSPPSSLLYLSSTSQNWSQICHVDERLPAPASSFAAFLIVILIDGIVACVVPSVVVALVDWDVCWPCCCGSWGWQIVVAVLVLVAVDVLVAAAVVGVVALRMVLFSLAVECGEWERIWVPSILLPQEFLSFLCTQSPKSVRSVHPLALTLSSIIGLCFLYCSNCSSQGSYVCIPSAFSFPTTRFVWCSFKSTSVSTFSLSLWSHFPTSLSCFCLHPWLLLSD